MEKLRLMRSDRRRSARVTIEDLNLDREAVTKMLTKDLKMRKISRKMVSTILIHEQKQQMKLGTTYKQNVKVCNAKQKVHQNQDQCNDHRSKP